MFQLSYINRLIIQISKIKWWCFCFQVHHRNSVRLEARERSLHMHCYRLHLRVLTYHAVNRQFYSPLSTSVEPNSPLSRGLIMVEVEGIAPSSCPSFDLYQQIVIYLYHRGILIVKRFFHIP